MQTRMAVASRKDAALGYRMWTVQRCSGFAVALPCVKA